MGILDKIIPSLLILVFFSASIVMTVFFVNDYRSRTPVIAVLENEEKVLVQEDGANTYKKKLTWGYVVDGQHYTFEETVKGNTKTQKELYYKITNPSDVYERLPVIFFIFPTVFFIVSVIFAYHFFLLPIKQRRQIREEMLYE